MRLMHNLASLNIYRNYTKTLDRQSETVQKTSSGHKISSAKEDTNGLCKSERMRMQIRGLSMASRNSQDGVSMLQTAEGGLDSITSILQRVRELGVKYKNDSNTDNDKKIIGEEINSLMGGYEDICKNTQFNGKPLLGNDEEVEITIGCNVGEVVKFKTYNLNSSKIVDEKGPEKNGLGINGDNAIEVVDKAIEKIVSIRSNYGAIENRFETTMGRLAEMGERIQGSESQIRDVDIAEEALNFSKDNILIESANALMVQTNRFPQDVLKILENVRSR